MSIKISLILLLLTGCASINVEDRIAAVNERPSIVSNFVLEKPASLELPPLFKSNDPKEMLLKMDEERRTYLKIVEHLKTSQRLEFETSVHILNAVKAQEVELKATERMLIRTEAALEQERRDSKMNDFFHRVIQIGLLGALLAL